MNLRSLPLLLAAAFPVAAAAQTPVPPTPNEDDIPKPVPVEVSLAGDPRPDISRFLNVRTAGQPSLSPDGRKVAFRTSITGEPQLWVVDAEGGWPRQLTFGEAVTFHAWSPAGDWILYGQDRGGNEREGYYLVSPDGTRERELLPPSDAFRAFGGFTRDGRRIAYGTTGRTGVDFDLHLLDVETGEDTRVLEGRMGLYPAAWRPDGGAVILTESRGEDAEDVYLFDVERRTLDTLFAPPDRASFGAFQWTPDGRGFYLATNLGREYRGLASYDVAARALEWLETPERDVDDVGLSGDGRVLVWTTNDGGYTRVHARNLSTGRDLPPPDLPRGVASVTWAPDAPVAAFTVSGPRVPGDVWTWDPRAGRTWRATRSATAGLDMDAMVVPEHVSFPARDGLTLHGLLYTPPGLGSGQRPPVLIDVHGGPTAQSRPSFGAVTQYLLTRGIAVFELNFRGSTGYGKSFARANDGRKRAVEYLDMADALDWLGAQGLVDAERAAVMGGSYGGYLTMAAVTRLADRFDAGVAFVGVSDWVTALEGASPQLKASDRFEYGDIDDPADRAFFAEISPIRYVDGDEPPVMVLHGANDPRDPVTESDQFVRAIREDGGRVEYLRFPDEGHGIRKLENRIIAYRRIADFLERELGVEGPTAYVPPPAHWERRTPAEAGFDPGALQAAVDYTLSHETTQIPEDPGDYLRTRFAGIPHQEIVGPTAPRGGVAGVILKDGYLVAEWGDTDREDMTFSVTKSYLSTVAGLAWAEGLIELDRPVAATVDDGTFAGGHNADITWRQLLQQTSEWEGTLWGKPDRADRREGIDRALQEPGTFWEYNDVRVNLLAYALLHVFGEPLPDVLRRRIMDPIGASDDWRWEGYETSWTEVEGRRIQSVSGGGHWGGGMFIDARDHARFGLLALRKGVWGEERLLPEAWFAKATTPAAIKDDYGFMWWLNTDRALFPAAPTTSFFALGAGSTNVIWVDPEHDIVTVTRWVDGGEHVDEFIRRVLAALEETRVESPGSAPASG